jgi:hypothetical protein
MSHFAHIAASRALHRDLGLRPARHAQDIGLAQAIAGILRGGRTWTCCAR